MPEPVDRRAPRSSGYPYLDEPVGVLAFAHRGGALHPDLAGIENTLAAFQHAAALGYVYLETDVATTRDGVLLAFHDPHLDRVTTGRGALASLTYAEVQEALVGGREPVPTLEQLLDAFPEARFNIDLKSPGAVAPLVALIEARGLHDRVLVGSFSAASLRAFRRRTQGKVATSAHPGEILTWLLSPSGRLADRLTGGRVQALQVPVRRHGVPVVTRRLVDKAHRAGKQVHVWTVDDPAQIRALLDLGVDGLFTDRTDVLRTVLSELGHWQGEER